MLKILSGSGDALRERMMDEAKAGGRLMVLVPEQFTLQTERDLMDGLGTEGFFDIEVLSPSRLKERVFALAGMSGRTVIDARGKQLALAKALLLCKKRLKYYESAAQKQGFIQKMGVLITECKQAGVTPEQLTGYLDTLDEGAQKDKITDLAVIYSAYTAQLADQFVDGEDVLEEMLLRLPDSGLAQGAKVLVYGFDVLSGQLIRLLLALARESETVQALLVLGEAECFAPVLECAMRLKKKADAAGLPCEFEAASEHAVKERRDLAHLSRFYLAAPAHPFLAPCPSLRLFAAPNPYFEAHFAAQEIIQLYESGVSFGEMAIVMGDGAFAGTLEAVLKSYQIPAYVVQKLPACSHGAARYLLSSLHALGSGYAQEDMLSLLQSGYAPLSEMDAWQMENYILAYGIRGKLWLSPFLRGKAGEGEAVEVARCALMEPLLALEREMADAESMGEVLRALFDYLENTGVYRKLLENREALLAQGFAAQAVQCNQIWETLMQLMNQAYALLAAEKADAGSLALWLEAGLLECNLSALPPSADAVMCGEVGALPLSHPRVLFFMNMTDALLASDDSALLTADEMAQMQKALDVHLAVDEDGHDALAYLDVWKVLSAPTEHLYLTRAQATQGGTALRPFAGLSQIRRLFPSLVEEGGVSQKIAASRPLAPSPALDAMGARMRIGAPDGEWLEAWKYLSTDAKTRARAQALCKAFSPEPAAPPLPREITQSLFMERVMSVSRLESFAVCPYRHFVEQGLAPQPRREWALTPRDAGTFYHSALEGFTRLLPTLPSWPQIDRKTCDALIDQAAAPLFEELLSGVMGDSARMRATGEKYRRLLHRVAWTFTLGARKSAFTPCSAEVKFGYPEGIPAIVLPLKNGEEVYVRGIIDRIDRYAGDEGLFLRVVDYKSGGTQLEPSRVFWGTQLQLLLYLQAALSMEDTAEPAGAFYMHLADPLLATEEEAEQVEEALARVLQLKGVALRDVAILRKMDDGTPPLSLPKTMTAKGDFEKNAMLATLSDLRALIEHAKGKAADLAQRMQSGEIAAAPLCDRERKGPCSYCDYAGICRKHVSCVPEHARIMEEMKFDELLERVNKNSAGNFGKNQV